MVEVVAILILFGVGYEVYKAFTSVPVSQLQAYAQNAGFVGNDLLIAVAIAQAESSGDANAYNPETDAGTPEGQGSYGLWQIYLNAHPEFSGQNLYDPQTNADAAYSIYSRYGFSAWSTYTGGQYLKYLSNTGITGGDSVNVGTYDEGDS